jgi:hypothetical protein
MNTLTLELATGPFRARPFGANVALITGSREAPGDRPCYATAMLTTREEVDQVVDFLVDHRAKLLPDDTKVCRWRHAGEAWDLYETACGVPHSFIAGGPWQNGYIFCPHCAGRVTQ